MRFAPAWSPPKGHRVGVLMVLVAFITLPAPGSTCPLCRAQAMAVIGGPAFCGNLLFMALPLLLIGTLVAVVAFASRSRHPGSRP